MYADAVRVVWAAAEKSTARLKPDNRHSGYRPGSHRDICCVVKRMIALGASQTSTKIYEHACYIALLCLTQRPHPSEREIAVAANQSANEEVFAN